jgi:hypothetical protein
MAPTRRRKRYGSARHPGYEVWLSALHQHYTDEGYRRGDR